MTDELIMGRLIEVTGHVAIVSRKVAGCRPWATLRFHGIDLDLDFYPRVWGLAWRDDITPGVKLKVSGRVDARKPQRLAVAVHEFVVLGK